MSTILKALRRLEEDRKKQSADEQLHHEVIAAEPARARGPLPHGWLVAAGVAALVLLLGVGVYLALPLRSPIGDSSGESSRPLASRSEPAASSSDHLRATVAAGAEAEPVRLAARPAAPADTLSLEEKARARRGAARRRRERSTSETRPPVAQEQGSQTARATSPAAALSAPESRAVVTAPPRPPDPWSEAPEAARRLTTIEADAPAPGSAEAPTPADARSSARRSVAVEPDAPAESQKSAAFAADTPESESPADEAEIAASPPSVRPSAAATEPSPTRSAPVGEVSVLRTVWHPRPERRVAHVSVGEGREVLKLHEGDAYADFVVSEIRLSSVVFEQGGVSISRRVGEGS